MLVANDSVALDLLDLTQIKKKLCGVMKWSTEKTDQVEKWYRRFLQICLTYPDENPVPSDSVDQFWHAHILDTKKYMRDCKVIFGHYVHHQPSYGDEKLSEGYDRTNELMRKEFGEDQTVLASEAAHSGTCCNNTGTETKCTRRCKKK